MYLNIKNIFCKTIYYQRKNHRLKEDWGAFIKFIEELPYFKTLILGEDEIFTNGNIKVIQKDANTIREAVYSAEILGESIVKILKECEN